MEHKTCSIAATTATVVVTAGTEPPCKLQPFEVPANAQALHSVATLTDLVLACSRAAALALASYTFVLAAWRARHAPWDLAFVTSAGAALAALLLCLHRIEKLGLPAADSSSSTAAKRLRRRLHAAVWALSAALSCAFAYRVSLLMPPALVALVWCMTSFVVLLGFYLLVLSDSDDQRYPSDVHHVDCAAADGEPLLNKTRPTDEMV